jgi:hypothetical protein
MTTGGGRQTRCGGRRPGNLDVVGGFTPKLVGPRHPPNGMVRPSPAPASSTPKGSPGPTARAGAPRDLPEFGRGWAYLGNN